MLDGGLQHHFPKILRSIAIFSNPGGFEGTAEIRRYETMETAEINGCQGTPCSEELRVNELH